MGRHRQITVSTGDRYGIMTVVREVEKGFVKSNPYPVRMVELKCDCGSTKTKPLPSLKRHKSCGCLRGFNVQIHGLSHTRLHLIWRHSKKMMCDEWRDSFKTFYDWAINNGYFKDFHLARKDYKKNYNPENSFWSQGRDNIKYLHRSNGLIEMIFNNEVKYVLKYMSVKHRNAIIDIWRKSTRKPFEIKIIPNWDIWNGKF